MKRKAQKFSFVMMIIFFLTGIAMTIVAAVSVGSLGSTLGAAISGSYGSSYGNYGSIVNPFAKYVFPTILGGLVLTFSVTAIWACVLEHFSNAEKTLDKIYRNNTGKEELPDSAYSYMPKFVENLKAPKPQQPYQPYPQQYAQPPMQQPYQQAQPMQQPVQPPVQSAPVQPPVQPAPQPPVQSAPVQQPQVPTEPIAAPQASGWICPNCGTTNAADANFCLTCGNKKN